MEIAHKVLLVLVTLLSVAAGVPKILRVPDELEFFAKLGLGPGALIAFGVAQSLFGVLLVPRATRPWAGFAVAGLLLASCGMLLLAGKTMFGLISVVPVLMTAAVIAHSMKRPKPAAD